MLSQKASFWDAVIAVQEHSLSGDKARATEALRTARRNVLSDGIEFAEQRKSLLKELSQSTVLDQGSAEVGLGVQRIVVSGIGRSGTTLIYQQLAKLLLLDDLKINFRYEPYLWNVQTAEAKSNPFDMSQMHQFGLMVHTHAPLFLNGDHPVHDPFIDYLFGAPWDSDPQVQPDAYLTKVIRGSGRLRSYLERFPDLRIIACLRNPVDTINSSLGMFSFFGEEFHSDDRPRFRKELTARSVDVSDLNSTDLSIEWYAKWWRVFTEETLEVARDYPENVFAFCYEAFQAAPDFMLETLMDFVGVRNNGMHMGLSKPAGPTIKSTNLTQHDISILKPQIDYYNDTVLQPYLGEQAAHARTNKVLSRYLGGKFTFPVAGSDLGRKSPIQLRGTILNGFGSPFLSLAKRPLHPINLPEMISKHHTGNASELYKPIEEAQRIKCGKRFGVVVTCHNNDNTIVDAVLSCLNQTLPYDEIIVVDDKSTDNSAKLLAELEIRYSSVRVLTLPSNLGPSAARDLGIRELTTEFFTQLDGDDLYWPSKNAQEAAALSNNENVVAFSDILLIKPEIKFVQSVANYNGKSGTEAYLALMSRTSQIPRDMTLSRKLYFAAGGYDMTRHLYEDWDFKLRLAAHSHAWVRAEGTAGTLYNRLTPGLSGVEDGQHARALSQIFIANIAHAPILKQEILPAFDSAIGRFADRHVSVQSRNALDSYIARGRDLAELAQHVMCRRMRAVDNRGYSSALNAYVDANVKENNIS